MMKDESLRSAILNHIAGMSFDREPVQAEVNDAVNGKPAPARPVATPQTGAPVPSLAATVPSSSAVHPDAAASAEAEEVVNSSSHRKEHARLTRRMVSIDPEKYPEMVKLWNGSRQESMI